MKTILTAIFTLIVTGSMATAQQAPMLHGDVSANVAERYNNTVIKTEMIDRTRTSSVRDGDRISTVEDSDQTYNRFPKLVTGDPMVHTGR